MKGPEKMQQDPGGVEKTYDVPRWSALGEELWQGKKSPLCFMYLEKKYEKVQTWVVYISSSISIVNVHYF